MARILNVTYEGSNQKANKQKQKLCYTVLKIMSFAGQMCDWFCVWVFFVVLFLLEGIPAESRLLVEGLVSE